MPALTFDTNKSLLRALGLSAAQLATLQAVASGTGATLSKITTISTVGAGSITATAIVGRVISRTGTQTAAFTDTTVSAATIIAALPTSFIVGSTFHVTIQNNTVGGWSETVTGGSGVTVSGITVIPNGMAVDYLLTYTAANTITMAATNEAEATLGTLALPGSSTGATTLKSGLSSTADNTLTLPITTTDTLAALGTVQTWTAAQTFTNSDLVLLGSSTGATTFTSANGGASNYTITVPAASGTLAFATGNTPTAVGASLAVTTAYANQTLLLSAASGSVATLPAATGTGNKYKFVVSATITSNSHKILAASSSDYFTGIVVGYHTTTTTMFSSAASTNHSIQMPSASSQPSGGLLGDWFECTDIAANLWEVTGMFNAGTTTTTPFSSATS